ncbi:MAG: transcriptional repressor [Opitutales bacterium]|nr:transcriptional repressor [Opitutales bacterium]
MSSSCQSANDDSKIPDLPQLLAAHGLRNTQQRRAIWSAAYETPGHFTAEELLLAARERDPSVSRATVYRSIPALISSGIVSELNVGRDFKYYESTRGAGTFKGHIVCDNCDKIIEFDAPFMDWYGRAIAKKYGLEFISQHLQITAACPKCGGNAHCVHEK